MKPIDGIRLESFIELDKDIFKDDFKEKFKKKSIYLLHYPKGDEIKESREILRNIGEDNYSIKNFCMDHQEAP